MKSLQTDIAETGCQAGHIFSRVNIGGSGVFSAWRAWGLFYAAFDKRPQLLRCRLHTSRIDFCRAKERVISSYKVLMPSQVFSQSTDFLHERPRPYYISSEAILSEECGELSYHQFGLLEIFVLTAISLSSF